MKAWIFRLASAATATFLLNGCSPRQEPREPVSEKSALKIGLMIGEPDAKQWAGAEEMFTKKLLDLGASLVKTTASSGPESQLAQAATLLDQGISALVIMPRHIQAAGKIADMAHARDVPAVACGMMLEDSDAAFFVCYDYEKTGYIQAKVSLAMAPEGNYIILGGVPAHREFENLAAGQDRAIKEHPILSGRNIAVLANPALETADAGEARSRTANMIRFFKSEGRAVAAVIAPNDNAADGVAEALEELGLSGAVVLAGQGAELDACRRLVKGTQAVTVYKSARRLAEVAAEAAVRLGRGETPEGMGRDMGLSVRYIDNGRRQVPSFFLTPGMVTRDRLPRTVLRDGLYSAEEIYGLVPR